jgi:putative transposase
MNFRRYYIPGSAVFLTQVVESREPVFKDQKFIELLKVTLKDVKNLHPFNLLGYVFLPDHLHLLIQPSGNENFSDIMHSLKPISQKNIKRFSAYLRQIL